MTLSKPLRGLLAATCAAFSLAAEAAPVSYSFTGTVGWDQADRGYRTFSGSFGFDSAATNTINDPSGSTGSYAGSGPAWSLSLAFDGGALLNFDSQVFVNVSNNLGGQDTLGLLAMGSGGTVSATLYDFSAALFSSAGLPLRDGGYTLADFDWADFWWEDDAGLLQGQFASLACTLGCTRGGGTEPGDPTDPGDGGTPGHTVPEPGSLVLATTALALLLRRRRRG